MQEQSMKLPWWIFHAYEDAKEEGFKGDLQSFVHDLLFEGLIVKTLETNKAKRDRNSVWYRIKKRWRKATGAEG